MDFKKLKAIAFDLDGTLYSSERIIAKSYQSTLIEIKNKYKLSFPIPTENEVIKLIGLPGFLLFKALTPPELLPYYDEFMKINSIKMQKAVNKHEGALMEGVPEIFRYLYKKKITACMVSNGSLGYLNNIINTYHLDFYNPVISLNYQNIQTKSDILEEYLLNLNIKADEIVMIGDRYIDLEAAKANKVFFIGLKSGIGYTLDPKELVGADLMLDNIVELHAFLKKSMDN